MAGTHSHCIRSPRKVPAVEAAEVERLIAIGECDASQRTDETDGTAKRLKETVK